MAKVWMQSASSKSSRAVGFTLIELSIVLVIIGLIVGGVLVGQDLIRAAEVRATVSQIEKYNTAVNTFRGKYNALPGDMNNATALQFGFTQRGQYTGQGDGNGVIEGSIANAANNYYGNAETAGETLMFWVDLTTANGLNLALIDGNFSSANPTTPSASDITGTGIALYLPPAKLGRGNYIYVYSGGFVQNLGPGNSDDTNYFGISAVTKLVGGANGSLVSSPTLPVNQAYSIDKKTDDGLPQSGRVTAVYLNSGTYWAAPGSTYNPPYTTPVTGSPTTCYDNGGVNGVVQSYSLGQNSGSGPNCAVSFRFQ